ncbi:probable glycerol-3-phosphate acyltransferase 3 [Benincasa hispida]|uniref:probable glycerol-3-phosphate acyltransferase 3 n=1 Tax=Benincasa hispida TaxID=102211 RepID=UPI001902970C|nr:probable glycerol-3-phosphate acyltransferase 3 [Benincasa hispida]
MTSTPFFFLKALFLFFHRFFSKKFRRATAAVHRKYQKQPPSTKLPGGSDDKVLIFNVEGGLLKPSSPYFFSYFMLVAFEAGGLLRATALLMSYPLIRLVGQEIGLKIMVMISFFGVKKDNFRVGSSVLPKFFLNDVGLEVFEALKKGKKRIGFSNIFPQVMIESFLRDYLEVEEVVGRELKVFCGYFVGLMEEKVKVSSLLSHLIHEEEKEEKESDMLFHKNDNLIGLCGSQKGCDFQLLSSICNEIYTVNEAEKKRWKRLPKDKFPKPLVFHDGRLALNPTPFDTLALFMWLPFALILAFIRIFAYIFLPSILSYPINAFSGMHLTISIPKENTKSNNNNNQGFLYVCNHRTLLDPLYISAALRINNPTAVTYSLSPISEFFSPIRTVRLTRNRDRDATLMVRLLSADGNLIVCPEGTTCREPYLLRFSPLFTEISTKIVPVANDTHVTMFYGTTASGFKCFDPLFFLMNPSPSYTVKELDMVDGLLFGSNDDGDGDDKNSTRFDVANFVQSEIGKALEFECTKLTRKDKYLILAGNEGIVHSK